MSTPVTFAIGDIHGCRQSLSALLGMLENRASELSLDPTYVFLGDYIDRGPDSRGVIDDLISLSSRKKCVFLKGNHEDMSERPSLYQTWMWNGGIQTLDNYEGFTLTQEHRDWISDLKIYHEDEDRIFVHAGLMPGILPSEVDEEDTADVFLWIRGEFLKTDYDWGKLVVHGHTPTPWHDKDGFSGKQNRINLDTGAVFGGKLTAAEFRPGQRRPTHMIQVEGYTKRD